MQTMIYDKVKEACKEKGVSVATVEKEAGMQPGTLCKWNRVRPIAANLMAVAKVLGKPIEYFLELEGEEDAKEEAIIDDHESECE